MTKAKKVNSRGKTVVGLRHSWHSKKTKHWNFGDFENFKNPIGFGLPWNAFKKKQVFGGGIGGQVPTFGDLKTHLFGVFFKKNTCFLSMSKSDIYEQMGHHSYPRASSSTLSNLRRPMFGRVVTNIRKWLFERLRIRNIRRGPNIFEYSVPPDFIVVES